jgi:hypothetical protein
LFRSVATPFPGSQKVGSPGTSDQRFDLAPLSREARSRYARRSQFIIGSGCAFVGLWGLLSLAHFPYGFDDTSSYAVLSVALLGAASVMIWMGIQLRHYRSPVAVSVGESAVTLEYEAQKPWTESWSDPKLEFVLADQRSELTPLLPAVSVFAARFPDAPYVPGFYFALSQEAYEALLGRARALQLSIRPQEYIVDSGRFRIPFSKGTLAYCIRAQGEK